MIDTILNNFNMITMEETQEVPTAMAIENGRIAKVGLDEEILELKESNTTVIDGKGQTILPGLFDAHGHFVISSIANTYWADMSCAPIGRITDMSSLLQELKRALEKKTDDTPLVGFGFDDTLMKEYRMPNAKDLDRVSSDVPIILIHISLHMLSANTPAMKLVGITDDSFRPEGGTVYYENGKPTGIFEEASAMAPFQKYIYPEEIYKNGTDFIEETGQAYLSKGITTTVEGMASPVMEKVLKQAEINGRFHNRIIVNPVYTDTVFEIKRQEADEHYINGPIKLFMDGSIQAYTAYLSKPFYKNHPTRKKPEGYTGFPSMSVQKLTDILCKIQEAGGEFAIHCNGDAAIDDVLEAYKNTNLSSWKDARNLIIHCQTEREDQLDSMKKMKLLPSFFPAHIYVWGDRHYDTFLGPERANRLEPMREAVDRDMIFSMHNDSPVTKADPLKLVWNAVARETATGRVLGENQKITVYEALKAVTIYAAYQYHMDQFTGSIKQGKVADFVVLEKNPLLCNTEELKNLQIRQTWIDGQKVYQG